MLSHTLLLGICAAVVAAKQPARLFGRAPALGVSSTTALGNVQDVGNSGWTYARDGLASGPVLDADGGKVIVWCSQDCDATDNGNFGGFWSNSGTLGDVNDPTSLKDGSTTQPVQLIPYSADELAFNNAKASGDNRYAL